MGLKDFFLGKKGEAPAMGTIALDPSLQRNTEYARDLQLKTAKDLQDIYAKNTSEQQASQEVGAETNALTSNLADIRRRVQEQIAKKGLGTTSLGMGQITGAGQDLAKRVSQMQESLPERIRQINIERQQALAGIGNQILQNPGAQTQQYTYDTSRSGGMLYPLLTAGLGGAGALLGSSAGPQGALAGARAGAMIGSSFQPR